MATTAAPALRTVAALRAGAIPAARPAGVVHLVLDGAPTPSGRWVTRGGRTACNCRTKRLTIVQSHPASPAALDMGGRRFCRRCAAALPPALGTGVTNIQINDNVALAYEHLTVADLNVATAWCRTEADTYQVGRVAQLVLGPAPFREPRTPGAARDRWLLERRIIARRNHLREAERSPEEREARARQREAEVHNDALMRAARRKEGQQALAESRALRGKYLMPHERELLRG